MQYANPLKFQGWHTLLNVSALSFSLPDSAYCNFYHYRGDFAHRVDRNVLLVGLVDFRSEAYPAVHEAFNRKGIRARGELAAYDGGREHVRLVTIGSKGKDYFLHHDVEIIQTHDAPADTVTFSETREISGPLIDMYLAGEIDEIDIVYTAYINTLRQEVTVKRLLPLEIPERKEEQKFNMPVEYVPSAAEVFGYLVPKYVELMIFNTCIESATCEYAARRTAMENANDNAKDMLSQLQLAYNHARQAEITDEIIEIVAGSEAQN